MVVVEGGPIWLYLLGRFVEIGLVVFFTVIWLLNMQRALEECKFSQRKIEPNQVWLVFIPLFGLVWQYIAIVRVSETLAQEYKVRGWQSDEDRPAIETGIVACTVVLIVLIVRLIVPDLHPVIGFFSSLGICLCMFMHRDRVKAFTERLETENRKAQPTPVFQTIPNVFQQQQIYYPSGAIPSGVQGPPQIPFHPQQQYPPVYNYPPQQYQEPQPMAPRPNPYAPPQYQPPVVNPSEVEWPPQDEQQPPSPWTEENRWQPPRQ